MLSVRVLLAQPKTKGTFVSSLLGTLSNQQRNLSNWTHRPTKDFEKENFIGKASHARREKEKKTYKWTVNPSVTRKEIEEHNSKTNAPGTKKEQVVTQRNKEFIQQIYAAAKQHDPKAAIEAYHRCSHGLDIRTYSAIIKSMEKDANHIGDAFQVYNDMKREGKKGNVATFTHLLNVCINANHLPRALLVMKEMMMYASIGKNNAGQATSFFKKLIRLCYINNEPGRAFAVFDCMRNAKVGALKPEELSVTDEIPFEYIRRVILEEIKIPKESEELKQFWIAMNKSKRPSFSTEASPMLPSSTNKSFGLLGKSEQRAHYEAELRKLKRLTEVDEDIARGNKALDFDEFGLSTRDHLELRSIALNNPIMSQQDADVEQSLKQSYKTASFEFSHVFYSTLFNDKNYTPLVDSYSSHTESLASQYSALLKNSGLSEKDITLEIESFKAFAEAHFDIIEQHLSEDNTITLTNEYLHDLADAMETNWTPAFNHDHQLISMIPTVAGASAEDSAVLLSQPMRSLMDKYVESESLEELDPVLDEYRSEMNKVTRYVNRKVDWQPVVLGVDGRPFFPSEDVISIDEVTTETIERAKQAYIDSIKDEEVKKQIKEEFYDYIHLVWIDGKGRVVEGISY